MAQHYPQEFAILHMVGGVGNSTKKKKKKKKKKACFYKIMIVNVNPVTGI